MVDRRAKLKTRSLERGKSAPLIVVSQNDEEKTASKKDAHLHVSSLTSSAGHDFKKRSFYKPTYCQHCSEMLWGFMNQGYQCEGETRVCTALFQGFAVVVVVYNACSVLFKNGCEVFEVY